MSNDRELARAVQLAAPVVLVALTIIGSLQIEPDVGERTMDTFGLALGVTSAASLWLRRRAPVIMLATVAVTLGIYVGLGYPGGPALLAGPVALVAFGRQGPRPRAYVGAAGLAVVLTVTMVVGPSDRGPWWILLVVGWAAAGTFAGDLLRERARRAEDERQRRREQQERARTEERLRVAHDLHDSIAHSLTTINVQAMAAAGTLHQHRDDTDQASQALEVIRRTSADALDELGVLVRSLRRPTADDRHPPPTLADVDGLIARARASGIEVLLDDPEDQIRGRLDGMAGEAASVAAYRVIQEGLTNVVRHAAGATATVRLQRGEDGGFEVAVRDDGGSGRSGSSPIATHRSNGLGLLGMRERVEATGGDVTAGPSATGGFEVIARWPPR